MERPGLDVENYLTLKQDRLTIINV